MAERDREFLAQLQAMDLNAKFQRTLGLVGEWHNYYNHNVYVSCSGGKDSTVLADIDAKWCKLIDKPLNLVFSNTGLEYLEIQRHVRELKPYFEDKYGIEVNLTVVRPKMQFSEVISKYGYPLIGKEVAEAIYYARRIRSDGSAERERERDGGLTSADSVTITQNTHTHTPRDGTQTERPSRTMATNTRKRAELTGKRPNGKDWKWGEKDNLIQTSTARNRRAVLQGKWGEAGVVGTHTNHSRETDGSYRGSEVPPG